MLCCARLCCTMLRCAALYCILLHSTLLYSTLLYCTVLNSTLLYCIQRRGGLRCIELTLKLPHVWQLWYGQRNFAISTSRGSISNAASTSSSTSIREYKQSWWWTRERKTEKLSQSRAVIDDSTLGNEYLFYRRVWHLDICWNLPPDVRFKIPSSSPLEGLMLFLDLFCGPYVDERSCSGEEIKRRKVEKIRLENAERGEMLIVAVGKYW